MLSLNPRSSDPNGNNCSSTEPEETTTEAATEEELSEETTLSSEAAEIITGEHAATNHYTKQSFTHISHTTAQRPRKVVKRVRVRGK